MDKDSLYLTDHEAALIALLTRAGPLSGHQVGRIYEKSPVSSFSSSKGTIYPMIARLRERGLVEATLGGERGRADAFSVTSRGNAALKAWVQDMRKSQVFPDDPMRTKLQCFDLLSRDEQIRWIAESKAQLYEKLNALREYRDQVTVPHQDLVHEIAVQSVRARIDWLDLVLMKVAQGMA